MISYRQIIVCEIKPFGMEMLLLMLILGQRYAEMWQFGISIVLRVWSSTKFCPCLFWMIAWLLLELLFTSQTGQQKQIIQSTWSNIRKLGQCCRNLIYDKQYCCKKAWFGKCIWIKLNSCAHTRNVQSRAAFGLKLNHLPDFALWLPKPKWKHKHVKKKKKHDSALC